MVEIDVPLGKLIYELAVEFGEIGINWGKEEIRLRCDLFGESLDHWINRDLRISRGDIAKLTETYKNSGKFSLEKVRRKWRRLGTQLRSLE